MPPTEGSYGNKKNGEASTLKVCAFPQRLKSKFFKVFFFNQPLRQTVWFPKFHLFWIIAHCKMIRVFSLYVGHILIKKKFWLFLMPMQQKPACVIYRSYVKQKNKCMGCRGFFKKYHQYWSENVWPFSC